MAINPLILAQGGVGLSYGLRPPQPQQQAPQQQRRREPFMTRAQGAGIAEALSSPIQVESGSYGEAIAEALTAGLRGMNARDERQAELDTESREQKMEDGQRMAIADALTAYRNAGDDPNAQHSAIVSALAGGAPEQALEFVLGRNGQRLEVADGLQLERERTPILADRQRQVGDIEVQQNITEARETAPYSNSGGSGVLPGALAPYQFAPDGTLRPIEGGPADVRQTAEGRAQAGRLESSESQLGNGIAVLNEVLGFEPDNLDPAATPAAGVGQVNGGTTGQWAARTREWGFNQGSADLDQALEPVRAIISFENLAEMRRNSATGGALGSIAVRELDLLGSTVRSLATNQSPEQLRRNLMEVRRQFIVTQRAIAAARAELQQLDGSGAPQPPRLRFNPATGQLE